MVRARRKRKLSKKTGRSRLNFLDVCKTPTSGLPIPIPFPNIGKSSDTSRGAKKVKINGRMPMTKGSKFKRNMGDESGIGSSQLSLRRVRRSRTRRKRTYNRVG
jgi:hypothetical protein